MQFGRRKNPPSPCSHGVYTDLQVAESLDEGWDGPLSVLGVISCLKQE